MDHWAWTWVRIHVHTCSNTSVMIYHCGVSLSEQHTDLLICHCTKQDLSHTSRYVDKSSPKIARYHIHMPTARAATVSVATYAETKLYTEVMTWAEFLTFISAVYAWPLPEAISTIVLMEILYCLWATCHCCLPRECACCILIEQGIWGALEEEYHSGLASSRRATMLCIQKL